MAVHRARLTAQLLAGTPATSVPAVVHRLLAVQAQDLRGARLAVRARSVGLRGRSVDAGLDEATLVVDWLCRGTLHLVRAEDHGWLHALTAHHQETAILRRLGQEAVPAPAAERGVAAMVAALQHGPLTRDLLREEIARADVPVAGQALVHLLALASLRRLVVRGPLRGRQQAFVLSRDWLGPPAEIEREAALAELAVRYLAGHGPASDRDLARWSGLPLNEVRRGLSRAVSRGRAVVRDDGLLESAGAALPAPLPPPRLLGAFEPLLLGWTSRDHVVGVHRDLITVNGVFRPFALVEGRAAARWSLSGAAVRLEPLVPLDDETTAKLLADGRDVVRYLAE